MYKFKKISLSCDYEAVLFVEKLKQSWIHDNRF